ncbi:cadmium-translocating P-type ATPase [Paludibaculum fermentans]|uniref:P-type Zn(2+) transporter n=2 Tax=Paludibaculum fermentans TaxID=1473598 RepID=A0A7S7SJ98_PALFE|nr:cadmium-translocating P-type ATPase [Paludibaculum fermentans]
MDCAQEVSLLRSRLSRVNGVRDLRFDVVQARMDVEYSAEKTSPEEIESAVASIGMRCEKWLRGSAKAGQAVRIDSAVAFTWASGLALAGGMAVEAWQSGDLVHAVLVHEHSGHHLPLAVQLCFWAAICAGAIPALPKAWAALRGLRADMNLLVLLSVVGASILGEWTEAATLSFLFALAGRMEHWSMVRARDAIARLLAVAPPEASVIHGSHEHRVAVETIRVGARVRVRPGERIPADGRVVEGVSFVNQALITGESVAVEKRAGEEVFAGTINESGTLEVETSREASDSTLARMIRMVEESHSRRAPSEQIVERFTRYYTPAVLLLALFVSTLPPIWKGGGWSEWFYQGMVVLLIACPCALVISTPVSIVAALTSAARQGVLLKGGTFLEEAARMRVLVLGRAGVLTSGLPEAADQRALNEAESQEIRNWQAWKGEQGVDWPLTPRTLSESGAQGSVLQAVEQLAGKGWTAAVWEESGHLVLEAYCDAPRQGAGEVLRQLKQRGVERVLVLTGDPCQAGRTAAAAAGVSEVEADLYPLEKAARVRELRRLYGHVGMVADGLTDAEALAEASLGITMGSQGADMARETADGVLMTNDLGRMVFLVDHSRRTLRVIKGNILFALGAKVLFLAAAMAGMATLWMAVAADMGATFAVTLNGLRLLRTKTHPTD